MPFSDAAPAFALEVAAALDFGFAPAPFFAFTSFRALSPRNLAWIFVAACSFSAWLPFAGFALVLAAEPAFGVAAAFAFGFDPAFAFAVAPAFAFAVVTPALAAFSAVAAEKSREAPAAAHAAPTSDAHEHVEVAKRNFDNV